MSRLKYYTGVGSRETPHAVLEVMKRFGSNSAKDGLVLRSGHAPGADTAFEEGCDEASGTKEIYIPWKGFNGSDSELYQQDSLAFEIASKLHPAWRFLKEPVRKLMARNVHQVLGKDLKTPSEFLMCWTPDGAPKKCKVSKETGGTGLAIRVAQEYGVEIINIL